LLLAPVEAALPITLTIAQNVGNQNQQPRIPPTSRAIALFSLGSVVAPAAHARPVGNLVFHVLSRVAGSQALLGTSITRNERGGRPGFGQQILDLVNLNFV